MADLRLVVDNTHAAVPRKPTPAAPPKLDDDDLLTERLLAAWAILSRDSKVRMLEFFTGRR